MEIQTVSQSVHGVPGSHRPRNQSEFVSKSRPEHLLVMPIVWPVVHPDSEGRWPLTRAGSATMFRGEIGLAESGSRRS